MCKCKPRLFFNLLIGTQETRQKRKARQILVDTHGEVLGVEDDEPGPGDVRRAPDHGRDEDAVVLGDGSGPGHQQVWSLSSFQVGRQVLRTNLNQVSSVSLLMTSSTTLANEGLFELTGRPLLTRAVSLSFAETTEEPGCTQVKRPKFCLIWVIFKQISPDYNL